ncbi:MAG: ATP-binding cassette domain-containing protein, partial [Thermoanaerobaculum sp.]|nr:ATP-binding cassette domain-containing protein [Thermoanaerobaculum sp.]
MIILENVSRVYQLGQSEVHALRQVSLEIAEGSFIALMGPSGSGKSTLLHILGLLDRPTSGRYLFQGRDVGQLSDGERTLLRREAIGFVFQFFHLLPRLSALGNVELPMIFAGVGREARLERAREALRAVGLAHRASHRPDQLSGG